MGARAACSPGGKISEVFQTTAEREGAYRLVENDDVAPEAIGAAAHQATAQRAWGMPFVFVPTDQSSLSLTDTQHEKGLGLVGARCRNSPGLNVMTAMAVAPDGTPLGVCGQVWWARKKRVKRRHNDRRKPEEKETNNWLRVMEQARAAFDAEASHTRLWFQEDRGADCWYVLLHALREGELLTVRANRDRRLADGPNGERDYVRTCLERQPVRARYQLSVAAGRSRTARTALIEMQWCPVTVRLHDPRSKQVHLAPMWAVRARESIETWPPDEERIDWVLLTTYPVEGLEDAKLVLEGYAARWRIEELHRVWKTGACRVEETQLRESEHIVRWATILASVAVRILRLTYLARSRPELPATVELTPAEIKAVIVLRKPKGVSRQQTPNIGDTVKWIAELGGYTGLKSSGGPPGPLVLTRGLHRVEPLAQAIADGWKEM